MKIARLKKVEIKLTVLIVISLILLTACGAQPTVEPTPVSIVVLIQPVSSLTPTSTPAALLPSETLTPEARMTVEQQLAYNKTEGVPVFVNGRGEVQFDWNQFYPDSSKIPEVDPANFATELEYWAAIFDKGLPPPDTTDPKDFTEVRWYSTEVTAQDITGCAINIISNDFASKFSAIETVGAVKYSLDGEPFVAMYGRGLLKDASKTGSDGNKFVTFWVSTSGHTFMNTATHPSQTINGILEGRRFIAFDTGMDQEAIQNGPMPDVSKFFFSQFNAYLHLKHANLVNSSGESILVLDDPTLVASLVEGNGLTRDIQGRMFIGGIPGVTDVLDRAFIQQLPLPTPHP